MIVTNYTQLDLTKKYSYADYLTWKIKDRIELIKGMVLKMAPGAGEIHQRSSSNLLFELLQFLKKQPCSVYHAPFDVRLLDKNKSLKDKDIFSVVQPDILVVCNKEIVDERGVLGAPDFIIEIISPGNSKREMKNKYELYELNGVKEYWIVHPTEQYIHQYYLLNKKYSLLKTYFDEDIIECKLFKGLKIKVGDMFL